MTAGLEARITSLPVWEGKLSIEPLAGGLSNQSFKVGDDAGDWVVRFGHDFPFHHVFRERELMTARAAAEAGFAPPLRYAEPGVMVSAFIDGATYDEAAVRANLERIAVLVRRFHGEMARRVRGPGFMFWVFHVIRDYAHTLEAGGSRITGRLPEFLALADELEQAQVPLPIVLGHNDLLPANVIDDGNKLWLIDFEYAGFSTAMFDLAGIASNAECGPDEAEALLTTYFQHVPDAALRKSHAAMQCASLLREALWSLVSELHLEIPGVDYVAYTELNLERLARALDAYRSRFGCV